MADISTFLSTKRLGMPTWIWVAVGVAAVSYVGFRYYQSKQAASSTSSTSTTGTSSTSSTNAAGTTAGVTNPSGYPIEPIFDSTTYNQATPQATMPTTSIPTALSDLQAGTYVVKGVTVGTVAGDQTSPVTDQYPGGIAQAVYNLGAGDAANIAFDSMAIFLMNPGVVPPYPVGTQISYPAPTSQDTFQLAPQTTSTTTTNTTGSSTGTTASGS